MFGAAAGRSHIESLIAAAAAQQVQSELAVRVSGWRARIDPILAAEEDRSAFDIHDYGSKILDRLVETTDVGNSVRNQQELGDQQQQELQPAKSEAIDFKQVAAARDSFEVCRLFAAMLQLVNNRSVTARNIDLELVPHAYCLSRSQLGEAMEAVAGSLHDLATEFCSGCAGSKASNLTSLCQRKLSLHVEVCQPASVSVLLLLALRNVNLIQQTYCEDHDIEDHRIVDSDTGQTCSNLQLRLLTVARVHEAMAEGLGGAAADTGDRCNCLDPSEVLPQPVVGDVKVTRDSQPPSTSHCHTHSHSVTVQRSLP